MSILFLLGLEVNNFTHTIQRMEERFLAPQIGDAPLLTPESQNQRFDLIVLGCGKKSQKTYRLEPQIMCTVSMSWCGDGMGRQNFVHMGWAKLKKYALQIIPYRENRNQYNQIKEL